MAKKKGKGGGKAAPSSENTSPTNVAEAESSAAQTLSPEQSMVEVAQTVEATSEPVAPPAVSTSEDVNAEEFKRELALYKSKIVELEAQNQALAEENQRLKSSQGASPAPVVDAGRQPDLDVLTQRIANLKGQQAEADAAREAAWSQLKNVVADIARLAAPDGLAKVGTPTAASASAFCSAA